MLGVQYKYQKTTAPINILVVMVMKGGGIQRGSSVYFVIFIILTTPADSGLITEQSVTECECPENRCPHRPEEG